MKSLQVHKKSVPDCCQLCGDDGQHRDVDTIEFIETTPGTTLTQSREDLTNCLDKQTKQESVECTMMLGRQGLLHLKCNVLKASLNSLS